MIGEAELDSMLLVDRYISKTIETIDMLEDVRYKSITKSTTITKANLLLDQIYKDRFEKNYRSAIRKCVFLKKYIERKMRFSDESR